MNFHLIVKDNFVGTQFHPKKSIKWTEIFRKLHRMENINNTIKIIPSLLLSNKRLVKV